MPRDDASPDQTGAPARLDPRVLHVLKYYRPDFTGEGVFLERVCVEMHGMAPDARHELLVTTTPAPAQPVIAAERLGRITYLTRGPRSAVRREAMQIVWFARNLHRFDVVHIRTHSDWYFVTYFMAKLARRKLYLTATLDDSIPGLVEGYRARLRPLARRLFRVFDGFISISPKLHQQTSRVMPARKCHLVPLGTNLPDLPPSTGAETRARLGIAPDALVLIFVGGLCARKDPAFLVRHLPAVLARRPDAVLLLVGPELEADHVAEMQSLAREAGIADRIVSVGEVTDPGPYFAAADIMTFASHAEGFGLVVPEAMAHGLPVVARRLPGVNENFVLQGRTGFLFDDEDQYLEATIRLACDAELRRRIGAQARDLVQREFTMNAAARKHLNIYTGHPGPSPVALPAVPQARGRTREALARRTLILADGFPPSAAEADDVLRRLAREGGGYVSVAAPTRDPRTGLALEGADAHDRAAAYRVWRVPALRPDPRASGRGLARLWFKAALAARLTWIVLTRRIDALCLGDPARDGWLMQPARHLLGLTCVACADPERIAQPEPDARLRRAMRTADAVLADGPAAAEAAVRLGAEPRRVHGPGADPAAAMQSIVAGLRSPGLSEEPAPGRLPCPPQAARVDLSTVERPLLMVLIDAEEEFDWQQISSAATSVRSMRHQVRAHRIFERYGLRPMYLVDFPVASQPDGFRPLQELMDSGVADVGAQLHPWVSPPIEEVVSEYASFPGNLPERLERAKLARLTREIEDRFGRHPDAYRAGRYGAGANTRRILTDLGYRVDCSVLPHNDFSDAGGPDYSEWTSHPTWLDAERRLLELPATVGFAGRWSAAGDGLYRAISLSAPAQLRVPGFFARLRLLERIKLTPEGTSVHEAKRLTNAMLAAGHKVFAITYHSPSLEVGHTPYVRTEAELTRFLDWLDQYCAWFTGEIGGQPSSIGAVHDLAMHAGATTSEKTLQAAR